MKLPFNIDIEYTAKAVVGIASPAVGFITSLQEQIEWHLRIASLLVGLAVGVLSLVAMTRKMRLKKPTSQSLRPRR